MRYDLPVTSLLSDHGDLSFLLYFSKRCLVENILVSFAAVIRVVTQRFSSGEKRCVTTLITAAKETKNIEGKFQKIARQLLSLRKNFNAICC